MLANVAGIQQVFSVGTNVPVSLTGTLVETQVGKFTIPGAVLASAGWLRWTAFVTMPVNANAKTARLRFGSMIGTVLGSSALAVNQASQNIGWYAAVREDRLKFAQVLHFSGFTSGLTTEQVMDLEVNNDVIITLQLGVISDTVTLEGFLLEGFKF